jgi:hypothetical protein
VSNNDDEKGVTEWLEMELAVAEHGTRWKYNSGCRCRACTQSNRDYKREYKRNGGAAPSRPREKARVSSVPDAPSGPGPAELAVLEELATLSAAETRLGAVQAALAMCRILDDPYQYPIHTRAAATLESILKLLRKLSGLGRRGRGRLAAVQSLPRRK